LENSKNIIEKIKSLSKENKNFLEIRVKPNSSKSLITYDKEKNLIIAYLHSIPENNRANDELIKLFKKQFKIKVEIISGFKSKNKKIKILLY